MGLPLRVKAATLVPLVLLVLLAGGAAAQRGVAPVPGLPPVSMTCPMHPDVVEPKPGSCPQCKMALVPVRLETAWMCPVHTTAMSDRDGTCPICRRQRIQARVAVTYTCDGQPGIDRLDPGRCPDGSPTIARRTLRPHGNHNPQHGGQFFMAPDNWHHLEGIYPRERVFRLYLYDDYARSLSPAAMKRVQARVVTRETFDPATRRTTEIAAFPLRVSANGAYLEARVDAKALPAEMTAKVKIKPDAPEYRFDFTFTALTKDVAAVSASPRPAAATARPATAAPPRVEADTQAGPAPSDPALAPLQIPSTPAAIIEQLKLRDGYVRELIRQGNFGAVWVPAFHAKDLAIALEPQLAHLPPAARELAEPALARVVRVAWLLDSYGDVGNRQLLEGAHAEFAAAIADVVTAFAALDVASHKLHDTTARPA